MRDFLDWCDSSGLVLTAISPADVGSYLDSLQSATAAASRHFHALLRSRVQYHVQWVAMARRIFPNFMRA